PSYYRKVWDVSKFADSANASYMPSTNNIVIPFGMMQAPFYDKNASRAENSGGLFFTICHELTHAFGSDGALYDEVGRKRNWWTDEDFAKFEERSKSMVSYYEQWEYKPGEKQDAKIALNENIADQGAIHCMLSLVGDDPEQQRTAMECFARCEYEMRPDAYYKIVIGRTHSFAPIRVNGTVAATDEFQKAYHVEPGDKMYVAPEARPRLW
ncbi:MAG: M13-type metalloendopeptidase, partial [Oscillospiraceae bacterium]